LIIDNNKIAMLGFTDDIVSHGILSNRLESFGWDVTRVDGHDVARVCEALHAMKTLRAARPKALIADTIKGRGVPGLENQALAHIMAPNREVLDELLAKFA
jgi:transketolase